MKKKLAEFGAFKHQEHNPRQWTQTDIDRLNKSLTDFGDLSGIVHDLNSGQIVSGNFRSEIIGAVSNPKDCEIEIVHQNEQPDAQGTVALGFVIWNGFRYNYRQVRWTQRQCEEACIKANYLGGSTDWDEMANYWSAKFGAELNDWGVDAWQNDDANDEQTATSSSDGTVRNDGFDVPVDSIAVKCKRGDVWQLGTHRLMCGDSISLDDVKRLMGGAMVDISFTSPPYNAGRTPTEAKGGKTSKYAHDSDDKAESDYLHLLVASTENALAFAKFAFVNVQSVSGNKTALIDYMYEMKSHYADTIIWDKESSQPAMGKNVLNSEFEYVHVFSEKATRAIGVREFRGTLSNMLHLSNRIGRDKEIQKIHSATFPLDFAAHFINNFTNDSVLDLFGGAGTTLIAAEQLGRKCFTMELDPRYCDVIIARWEKFTGQTATKIEEAVV